MTRTGPRTITGERGAGRQSRRGRAAGRGAGSCSHPRPSDPPPPTASDYAYLREHFREKHFLCEEGRCSTEQFTHAFRTEIDLKAHRTACHSRSRAEARQNRQIDLQFSYAPRHSRRNEGEHGLLSAERGSGGLQSSDPGPGLSPQASADRGRAC